MLTLNVILYRMHQNIMSWPSTFLYDNLLEADSSVATHVLRYIHNVTVNCEKCIGCKTMFSDLPGVMVTPLTSIPLIFVDTAGCNMNELDTTDEESKGNEGVWVSVCVSVYVSMHDTIIETHCTNLFCHWLRTAYCLYT